MGLPLLLDYSSRKPTKTLANVVVASFSAIQRLNLLLAVWFFGFSPPDTLPRLRFHVLPCLHLAKMRCGTFHCRFFPQIGLLKKRNPCNGGNFVCRGFYYIPFRGRFLNNLLSLPLDCGAKIRTLFQTYNSR